MERIQNIASPEPVRYVVCSVCGPPNLANSTCKRTRMRNGQLLELVTLDGAPEGLCDGELDRFVSTFPIRKPIMTNLQRRIRKLETFLSDPSGLIPHSQKWLEYWDREIISI